ncbi:hypothetical protein BK133_29885 [Paenibacillus sp. FSL H8-0548]|uniref:hypothetical protein n=1 Tax=Paenibacillus sp. FSL H8-0548 TaxID=1920422 RepID=UPI00096D1BD8|nr:hypothetical protein [Paenibacillus sp. FSL H8-0548]OMF19294.1 hypothetical protein BK133_29885 [Paenibacillus sp. FSL H8-0548]
MKVTIGIFKREEGVLDAAQAFQATNTGTGSLRIIVKNKESAPLLASQSSTPVEEVYEIREAQERGNGNNVPIIGAAPISTAAYSAGGLGIGTNSGGVVVNAYDPVLDQHQRTQDVLHAIGIPGRFVEECGDAIEQGHFLLVTQDESGAAAEELLLRSGAFNVIHE